jgi:accessory colonization factor AcfC
VINLEAARVLDSLPMQATARKYEYFPIGHRCIFSSMDCSFGDIRTRPKLLSSGYFRRYGFVFDEHVHARDQRGTFADTLTLGQRFRLCFAPREHGPRSRHTDNHSHGGRGNEHSDHASDRVEPDIDYHQMRILIMNLTLRAAGALCLVLASGVAAAQSVLHVYGPGGPAPAMKEAAVAFEKKTGTHVEVTAGPTRSWIDHAREDADVIYSGSETMMSDFVVAMGDQLTPDAPVPLYLRSMSILVRPGNPRRIHGFADLLRPGVKVLVVNGAGQNGVWEDVAGRAGDIGSVAALRRNIVSYAGNSALARQTWVAQPDIDVWLIWNIWQVANPSLADTVSIEPRYAIYRDAGVAVTKRGSAHPASQQFVDFLKSPQGAAIFSRWGWMTASPHVGPKVPA